jgi:spermidine/putrescine ABC transporter ATP-binding subunit
VSRPESGARVTGATVRLTNIHHRFGEVVAVRDVNLTVRAGEFLTLLGPSGSGKTTTLNIVAGFLEPTSGDVSINDEPATYKAPHLRNIGMVFQNYALWPHMTVFQNVAFPLRMRKEGKARIRARVEEALTMVRLQGLEARLPRQLSGGQQQRVALARALVFNPPLLLMDEPLGALDKKLREQMQLEIKHLQKRLGITVIYVTHDQEEALFMSDRVAVTSGGTIVQIGTPVDLYNRPANRFVADFIGESNFVSGKVQVVDASAQSCRLVTEGGLALQGMLGHAAQPGDSVVAAVRPEKIRIQAVSGTPAENSAAVGTIVEAIYLGDWVKYRIELVSGETMLVKVPGGNEDELGAPGTRVVITIATRDLMVYRE